MVQGKRVVTTRLGATLDEKGITSKKIAQITGVSQGTMSNWTSGRTKPKFEQMKKIAEFLNIDLLWLFE